MPRRSRRYRKFEDGTTDVVGRRGAPNRNAGDAVGGVPDRGRAGGSSAGGGKAGGKGKESAPAAGAGGAGGGKANGKGAPRRPADWTCEGCKFVNFGSRDACLQQCGKAPPAKIVQAARAWNNRANKKGGGKGAQPARSESSDDLRAVQAENAALKKKMEELKRRQGTGKGFGKGAWDEDVFEDEGFEDIAEEEEVESHASRLAAHDQMLNTADAVLRAAAKAQGIGKLSECQGHPIAGGYYTSVAMLKEQRIVLAELAHGDQPLAVQRAAASRAWKQAAGKAEATEARAEVLRERIRQDTAKLEEEEATAHQQAARAAMFKEKHDHLDARIAAATAEASGKPAGSRPAADPLPDDKDGDYISNLFARLRASLPAEQHSALQRCHDEAFEVSFTDTTPSQYYPTGGMPTEPGAVPKAAPAEPPPVGTPAPATPLRAAAPATPPAKAHGPPPRAAGTPPPSAKRANTATGLPAPASQAGAAA